MSSVYGQIRQRLGATAVITLGADGTSFRGTLLAVHPVGEDVSDAGENLTSNDYIELTFKLNRAKS